MNNNKNTLDFNPELNSDNLKPSLDLGVSNSVEWILSREANEERAKRIVELNGEKEVKEQEIKTPRKELLHELTSNLDANKKEVLDFFNSDEIRDKINEFIDENLILCDNVDELINTLKEMVLSYWDNTKPFNFIKNGIEAWEDDFMYSLIDWEYTEDYFKSIEEWEKLSEMDVTQESMDEKYKEMKSELINTFFETASNEEKEKFAQLMPQTKEYAVKVIAESEGITTELAEEKYNSSQELQKTFAFEYVMYNEEARTEFMSDLSDERQAEYRQAFDQVDSLNKQIYAGKYGDFITETNKQGYTRVFNKDWVISYGDQKIDTTKRPPVKSITSRNGFSLETTSENSAEEKEYYNSLRESNFSQIKLETQKRNLEKDLRDLIERLEELKNELEKEEMSDREKTILENQLFITEREIEEVRFDIDEIKHKIEEIKEKKEEIKYNFKEKLEDKDRYARQNMRLLDNIWMSVMPVSVIKEIFGRINSNMIDVNVEPGLKGRIDLNKKNFWMTWIDESAATKLVIRLFNKMISGNQDEPNNTELMYKLSKSETWTNYFIDRTIFVEKLRKYGVLNENDRPIIPVLKNNLEKPIEKK